MEEIKIVMNKKIKKVVKYIFDADYRFLIDSRNGKYNDLEDEEYIRRRYRAILHKEPNLDNPRTFCEKLQWLKLHDRNAIYTKMVDKYEVKKMIEDIIGEEYIIPTIGVWSKFDDIDFEILPEKFVLKCTHDSGGVVICRDKSSFDKKSAREKLEKSLKTNFYFRNREWPYKNVTPRIIAEQYIENSNKNGDRLDDDVLTDYKFFCFNGVPKFMYISKDKGSKPETDFFDMQFNHLPLRMRDPNAEILPKKPAQFERMVEIASILSEGYAHLRVDFYAVDDKIYIGELTLYHCGGFFPIYPDEWEDKIGDWIELPKR